MHCLTKRGSAYTPSILYVRVVAWQRSLRVRALVVRVRVGAPHVRGAYAWLGPAVGVWLRVELTCARCTMVRSSVKYRSLVRACVD